MMKNKAIIVLNQGYLCMKKRSYCYKVITILTKQKIEVNEYSG
jgi:hypothetical protein